MSNLEIAIALWNYVFMPSVYFAIAIYGIWWILKLIAKIKGVGLE
jgi:hypothetical protein